MTTTYIQINEYYPLHLSHIDLVNVHIQRYTLSPSLVRIGSVPRAVGEVSIVSAWKLVRKGIKEQG